MNKKCLILIPDKGIKNDCTQERESKAPINFLSYIKTRMKNYNFQKVGIKRVERGDAKVGGCCQSQFSRGSPSKDKGFQLTDKNKQYVKDLRKLLHSQGLRPRGCRAS